MRYALVFALLMIQFLDSSASVDDSQSIKATTAITLPLDSVTVYPDGLLAVKRHGSLEVTEGLHSFVLDLPDKAEAGSALLNVSNSKEEMVVYEKSPIFYLNITSPGEQNFDLSYLMYDAASWKPRYDLHLEDEMARVSARAIVGNFAGEELKGVRLKLVTGLPATEPNPLAKSAPQAAPRSYWESNATVEEYAYQEVEPQASGELETMYIFELQGRKDLEMNREIGFPLFEAEAPLVRVYTWDATSDPEGPVRELMRANNTLENPWPSGEALLYRNGEYLSTIQMPYTPSGTNASIDLGPSADLKVASKLVDYNITEEIGVMGSDQGNHTVKKTLQSWSYSLVIKNNLRRDASLEVVESVPQESVISSASPEPDERTATGLKWKLSLEPRQKLSINYTYDVTTTESLDGYYY